MTNFVYNLSTMNLFVPGCSEIDSSRECVMIKEAKKSPSGKLSFHVLLDGYEQSHSFYFIRSPQTQFGVAQNIL